ncbi:hypothetical protein D3C75_187040 [compost metagenome]
MGKYQQYMTQEMLDVVGKMNMDYMKQEFLFCNEKYLEAYEAYKIELPATAASGELVRHGSRMEVKAIANYWEYRRDLIKGFLPRDWVEEQDVNSMLFKSP